MGGLGPERGGVPVRRGLAVPAGLLLAGAEEGARVPVQHLLLIIHGGARGQGRHTSHVGPATGPLAPACALTAPTYLVSEPWPSASEPLRPPSSSRAPPRRLSVVNMPLTSRYTHSVITLDCYRDRDGLSTGRGGRGRVSRLRARPGAHMVQRGLVQRQAVVTAPIRVAFEQEHGDMALSAHNDHVGVGHGTLHDGGAQVHGDEV